MSKYYLIKCNKLITARPNTAKARHGFVELTEEELSMIILNTIEHPQQTDVDESIINKIREVLE